MDTGSDPGSAPPAGVTYVQTASGLGVNLDGRITLHGAAETIAWFADRPVRLAGSMPTSEFVARWARGPDTFAENPPNALVSCPTADGAKTMTVILSDPRLDGDSLSYAVDLVDGALTPSEGPVSISIH